MKRCSPPSPRKCPLHHGSADAALSLHSVLIRIMMNCWQEKWFLSAACRDVPSSCIAAVTAGQGWGIREMSQQAFFHNMPLAFATAADYATYLRINKDLQSLSRRKSIHSQGGQCTFMDMHWGVALNGSASCICLDNQAFFKSKNL